MLDGMWVWVLMVGGELERGGLRGEVGRGMVDCGLMVRGVGELWGMEGYGLNKWGDIFCVLVGCIGFGEGFGG